MYVRFKKTNNGEIALLFDKLPTPGGDHCHGLHRLFAPPGREIITISADHRFIRESDWPVFARRQVELLVGAGISRTRAEEYYSLKPER